MIKEAIKQLWSRAEPQSRGEGKHFYPQMATDDAEKSLMLSLGKARTEKLFAES